MMTSTTTVSAYQRSLDTLPFIPLNFFRGDSLEGPAFITTGTGGDLHIVAGSGHYLLPFHAIRDLLFFGHDVPLLLPGGVIDAEAKVSPHSRSHTVFFTLHGGIYSVRWSEFAEVARGDVQYAPLMLSPGRGFP